MSEPIAVVPVTRTIDQPRINAYADASGDHNPLHIDAAYAASTPFGGPIAHGMLVFAMVGEMMHAALGERWLAQGRLKVRFKAPARPGDTVTASATAAANGDYAVQCANERGEVLIEGRAGIGGAA